MAQDNFVVYTPEMDKIIKEEAKASPKNLAASFRASAKRIEDELGEKNATPEKIQARFYLKHNKRKASTSSSNGNKTRAKKTAPKTVKTVEKDTNVTEELTDDKYMLVKSFVEGLPKEKRLALVKDVWDNI